MIDTSVLIAVIAGVVGLLTLAIQTWGSIQLARLKEGQKEGVKKTEETTAKLEQVHVAVNSERTAMLAKLEEMHAKISKLEASADARSAADSAVVSYDAGRKQGQSDSKA